MIENSNLKLEQAEILNSGDGLNWYVYCGNDPVNRVDPLGLCSESDGSNVNIEGVIIGSIGIITGTAGIVQSVVGTSAAFIGSAVTGDDTTGPAIAVVQMQIFRGSVATVGFGIVTLSAALKGEELDIPISIEGLLE